MHSRLPYTKKRTLLVFAGIIVLCTLFLLPYLGSVNLFDSDEVKYAESSREMILTGDYMNVQIDFEPFPEKPPLFFWLQVISMKIFGVNEFAARFPNFICSIVTLMILYSLRSEEQKGIRTPLWPFLGAVIWIRDSALILFQVRHN